jgi:catechol 2,3-dioxygenase-like lactoylglutathione lyase family enzyme
MVIERIEHIVLTVKDIHETSRFYSSFLGLQIVTFGEGRKALVNRAPVGCPEFALGELKRRFLDFES